MSDFTKEDLAAAIEASDAIRTHEFDYWHDAEDFRVSLNLADDVTHTAAIGDVLEAFDLRIWDVNFEHGFVGVVPAAGFHYDYSDVEVGP